MTTINLKDFYYWYTQDQFIEVSDEVAEVFVSDARRAPRTKELHLFSGFLRCADCGKSVTRSSSGQSTRYLCSTYKNRSRTACTMHSIKHALPYMLQCLLLPPQ